MDEHEGQTDRETCEIARAALFISRAEYYEHEEEGAHNLHEETAACSACVRYTVCTQTCRVTHCARSAGHFDDEVEYGCSQYAADNLSDPITAGILPSHTAGKGDSECDGRVDMAT